MIDTTSPLAVALPSVLDARHVVSVLLINVEGAIGFAMGWFLVFFLLRALLKQQWLAALVMVLLGASGGLVVLQQPPIAVLFGTIGFALSVFILLRFGVLLVVAQSFVVAVLTNSPMTIDFSAWYASSTMFALTVVLALAAYAFHTAVAGRPLFKTGFLEAD